MERRKFLMLTLGSLFDGIGGWQLAAVRAGIKPVWASEINTLRKRKKNMSANERYFPALAPPQPALVKV